MAPRIIAVDWTGAKEPVRNLWLAEAEPGRLMDVRRFDRRRDLIRHLVGERETASELVVGFDFAFSLPSWFLKQRRLSSAQALWRHMARHEDRWLAPEAPFWEAAGAGRPPREREFRRTDDDLRSRGWHPSSPFKLVGPSQVGRGSLRGMRHLAELEEARFNIWPFGAGLPLVVEIYPAALADFAGKSDPAAIANAVKRDRRIRSEWKAHAACSQDAFDAAMSALRMADCGEEFAGLKRSARDSRYDLEGRIWMPGSR